MQFRTPGPAFQRYAPHPGLFAWAKRQQTPTAEFYRPRDVFRPWQIKRELEARVLVSSDDARAAVYRLASKLRAARARVRELEKDIAGGDLSTEDANALLGDLDAARHAATPPKLKPRWFRRAKWRADRKERNEMRINLNETEGPFLSRRDTTQQWRGDWATWKAAA